MPPILQRGLRKNGERGSEFRSQEPGARIQKSEVSGVQEKRRRHPTTRSLSAPPSHVSLGLGIRCAMLSSGESFSRRNSGVSRRGSLTAPDPIIPLCGLRDLCAMLSPANRSRTGAVVSPDTAAAPPPPQWECRGISAPLLPTRKSKSTPWSACRT